MVPSSSPSINLHCCPSLSVTVSCCLSLSLTVCHYLSLSLAISHRPSLSFTVPHHPSLSLANIAVCCHLSSVGRRWSCVVVGLQVVVTRVVIRSWVIPVRSQEDSEHEKPTYPKWHVSTKSLLWSPGSKQSLLTVFGTSESNSSCRCSTACQIYLGIMLFCQSSFLRRKKGRCGDELSLATPESYFADGVCDNLLLCR